MALKHLKKTV